MAHRQLMQAHALAGDRQAALAQFETCKEALWQELAAEPEAESIALAEQIAAGEVIQLRARPRHNLIAPVTPFFGREADLAAVHARITQRDYRLVTLVGEGGIGKSRLALEVAWRLREQFADGVWFVPLVGLEAKPAGGSLNELTARQNLPQVDSLPDAIATAVAQTLDYLLTGQQPPRDQLLAFLRERQLLLVLDNFEQLLAGAQLVLDLLHQAPGVCVICTSREPLNFQAEWVLLTPVEQAQLASLSVFLGPFSMRSAETVSKATLHELQTLQEKSLLQRQGERFAFHSLLRQFAAEKLANFPENEAAVRHSH